MSNKRPDEMQRIESREQALAFIEKEIEAVKAQVGDGKVLLALSGGVDSSVVAALLIKAIGKNLVCVHVNHGLLRKGEPEQVVQVFRHDSTSLAGLQSLRRRGRSSVQSSSGSSRKRLGSSMESDSLHREPSILIS